MTSTMSLQPNGYYSLDYGNQPKIPGAGLESMFEFFAEKESKEELRKKLRLKIKNSRARR